MNLNPAVAKLKASLHSITMARGLTLALACLCLSACEKSDDSSKGLASDRTDFGDNDSGLLLAVGDSITSGDGGTPYTHYLRTMISQRIVNEGIDGTRSFEGASRLPSLLKQRKPGYVVIMYGANDASQGYPLDQTMASLRKMVTACKNNKSVPILCTVTPQTGGRIIYQGRVNSINEAIRSLVQEENIALADVAKAFGSGEGLISRDNLHPGETGLMVIAETVANVF